MARNFAQNSSFEADLTSTWEVNGVATADRRTADSVIGDWHVVMVGTGAGNPNLETHDDALIAVAEGEPWTFSAYLRWLTGTPKPCRLDVRWFDATGAVLSANIGGLFTPSDTAWMRIGNNNNVAPAGAVQMSVRVVVIGIDSGDELGIDGVMVEQGDVEPPSPWSPGPDESIPEPTIQPQFGVPVEYGQAELRGLIIGKGTPLRLNGFNPFDNTVRVQHQEPLSQADGAYSGREYADIKQVPVRITVDVPISDQASRFNLHQEILKAFAPSDIDLPLRFVWAGRQLRLNGRPRVVSANVDHLTTGIVRVEAGFVALDPLIYSDVEVSASLLLPSDAGGLTMPFTLPTSIDAVVSTGRRDITNQGTAAVSWRGIIFGPVTNPRLVNFTTGEELRIGVEVPDGRYLDLNSATRSVLLDGTASRRGTVSGQWWQLQPGANDIGWFSDVGSDTATFQISFRHAWR